MRRRGSLCCGCERAEATFRPTDLRVRGEPMKSYSGGLQLNGTLKFRSLQAVAVTLLFLMLPIGAAANAAVPASGGTGAHVYLLRGVLNIFSLGLDDIAAKLQAQGIPVTVVNYLSWSSLADEAAAEYRSGRVR